MKRPFPVLLILVGLIAMALIAAFIAAWGWVYTTTQLALAGKEGIYPSAQEGMLEQIRSNYRDIERIEIEHAGTNSFDGSHPHVWFVAARVWAGSRVDGSPVGSHGRDSDYPGSFFLRTRKGWVHVPEGAFPELIGFWMEVYGLAGES